MKVKLPKIYNTVCWVTFFRNLGFEIRNHSYLPDYGITIIEFIDELTSSQKAQVEDAILQLRNHICWSDCTCNDPLLQ